MLHLQPEWKRFITQVKQTKVLHDMTFHQIFDILKQNQDCGKLEWELNDVTIFNVLKFKAFRYEFI